MYKTLAFFTVFLISMGLSAQSSGLDRFIDKYSDQEDISMVYVSPKMFKMVAKVAGEELDKELSDFVKSLDGLKILTSNKNINALYKEADAELGNGYELLMTARDNGEKVKIMTKSKSDDVIEELVLLVGGESEFTLVSFSGNINLKQLGKIASSLNIQGMEHLKKIGQE